MRKFQKIFILPYYKTLLMFFSGFKLHSGFTFACNKKRRNSILVIKSVD